MSIDQNIENQYKDKSGSIAKNRLTIQTSYAIKLLVDFFNVTDYVVFLDCIEDVALKTIELGNEKIYLYQVKTKNKGGYSLTTMIREEWLQKLYSHKKIYDNCNYEISLVLNEFATGEDGSNLFANEKAKIETDILEYTNKKAVCTQNLKLIKKKISEYENITEDEVNLSNLYFIKTNFHLDTHKDQAHKILSDFIESFDDKAEVIKVKAFFTALYNTLDNKFNYELEPKNTSFMEIQAKKGFTKQEFKNAINDYLSNSIPKSSELFQLMGITSVAEQKEINAQRSYYLIDLSNKDAAFEVFVLEIDQFIKTTDTRNLLKDGVDLIINNQNISPVFKETGYIKFALLHRYKTYLDGGNFDEQSNF